MELINLSGYVNVRVLNVGVEGGSSETWIVPWPGLLVDGGKGEENGMLYVQSVTLTQRPQRPSHVLLSLLPLLSACPKVYSNRLFWKQVEGR